MPSFVTFDELEAASKEDRSQFIEKYARDRVGTTGKTVFLSHSSKDEKYLPAVVKLLENHGGKVYIDRKDERLPEKTSPETAQVLRSAMKECQRLVVFVTTNSKDSKWVPWELGYADGQKNLPNIALLPAAQHSYDQLWAGQEYLGVYQRIVWGQIDGHPEAAWIVHDHHNNTAAPLSDWLAVYSRPYAYR